MRKVDYMKPSPWKKIAVKNATTRTLKNGKVIPTWEAMQQAVKKI